MKGLIFFVLVETALCFPAVNNEGPTKVYLLTTPPQPVQSQEFDITKINLQPESALPNIFGDRIHGREQAVKEQESKLRVFDTAYMNIQKKVSNHFQIEPIIDNTQEKNKYGNTGANYRSIGNGLVDGFEVFSNILNGVFEKPEALVQKAKQKLNVIFTNAGATFIG